MRLFGKSTAGCRSPLRRPSSPTSSPWHWGNLRPWSSTRHCSRCFCSCSPVCTCSCCRIPPSCVGGEAPPDRSEPRNGQEEVGEGRKETRREKWRCEADPPLRRQSPDREGRRRCTCTGLHRGHAGLE